MAKLIFGCGYLGLRVAKRWLAAGEDVFAVTRNESRVAALKAVGLAPVVADVTEPATLADLPTAETVLFAVGYDRTAGHDIREVYVQGLQNVLDALPEGTGQLIYISSTGVYAQDDGNRVDEDSPCEPQRPGGIACLAAEQLLAAHRRGAGATILRMAGLYGPGRVPRAEQIAAGEPIPAPVDGYLNLIHIDDAANIVLVSEGRHGPLRTFLVSDGEPVLRREYFAEIARQLAAPAPQFAETEGGPTPSRGTTNKRISNARMLAEFEIELQYLSYREGLAAILKPQV